MMPERPDARWDFGDKRDDPIHRIHSYPAKFPAFITTRALQYARDRGVRVQRIADVFCGCGTTAVEAKRNGKRFWGCDINPLAALIAQVKTHSYRDSVLTRYYDSIHTHYLRSITAPEAYARVTPRMRYWFEDQTIDELLRLEHAIRSNTTSGSAHRRFFLCAFSNILKPTSRWLTKSIKAQLDPNKTPRPVLTAFESQFALMRAANNDNWFPSPPAPVTIRTLDFLATRPANRFADLIVTSPPYVTSYDYASIHQLSTLWLRYNTDYREIRNKMLGNQYAVSPPDPVALRSIGAPAAAAYRRLLREDRRRARSVGRYFLGIDRAIQHCAHMLNAKGMLFLVIGNTQYNGVTIDNAAHVAHCMMRYGLTDVHLIPRKLSRKTMTPYRDTRGRFTRSSKHRTVYGAEFVVVGTRK